jgi:hypothetical protein
MSKIKIISNPTVKTVYSSYPKLAKANVLALRDLILETANELENLTELEETLKWGEPSFLAKGGSTIRIAWSAKKPEQYGLYFQCSSSLISTFKITHEKIFRFEGKRAIIFKLGETLPEEALKICIKAALQYHKVKHLATLGI